MSKLQHRFRSRIPLVLLLLATSGSLVHRAFSQTFVEWPIAAGGNGHLYAAVSALPGGIDRPTANAQALALGGTLVTIGSATENAFVFSLIDRADMWMPVDNNTRNGGPWIGAFQQTNAFEPDCGWVWDGGELWTYDNWEIGEPNNVGAGEGRMLFWSNNLTQRRPVWNDWPGANLTAGYVVEIQCAGLSSVPADVFTTVGANVTMTVTATGTGPLQYRWRYATNPSGPFTPLSDGAQPSGGSILGSATSSLRVNGVTQGNAGYYSCQVSNPCGSFEGRAVALVLPTTLSESLAVSRCQPVEIRDLAVANRVDLINNNGLKSITLEDASRAITVFGSNAEVDAVLAAAPANANVLSRLRGVRIDFNGIAEIVKPTALIAANTFRDIPRITVSAADFADNSSTAEALESRQVELPEFAFPARSGSPVAFVASTGYLNAEGTVRLWVPTAAIATSLGTVPNGRRVRVFGIFSQFDQTPPFAQGYELVVTSIDRCDSIDFNNNTVFPEDADVIDFFTVLAGGECALCNDIDFNNNTVFPEDQDVIDFFNVLAGGTCP